MAIKASNQVSIIDVTDGEDGRSVSSIVTEYYLSTSNTELEGGSWSETIPTWESGKYLWTRSKIEYTNPSSTEYSTAVCDNSLNEMVVKGTVTDELNAELTIDGNTITVKAGDLVIDSDHLSLDADGNLIINTNGLTLDSSGNASFLGDVKATNLIIDNGLKIRLNTGLVGPTNPWTYTEVLNLSGDESKGLSLNLKVGDTNIFSYLSNEGTLYNGFGVVKAQKAWTFDNGLYINNTSIFDAIYPVGSIYMSVNNTNPKNLFGGTWVAWGSGRVPVGVNTSDSNFKTVEKTGGASTHTLTTAQLPSHNHALNIQTCGTEAKGYGIDTLQAFKDRVIVNSGSYTWYTTSTGSGQAHNNLQPYITCYMWKRTA